MRHHRLVLSATSRCRLSAGGWPVAVGIAVQPQMLLFASVDDDFFMTLLSGAEFEDPVH
jgi:hypothetical protein